MVGDHIVSSPDFSCVADILLLGIKKLGIRNAAVALPTCDKPAMIGFLRVLYIVNDVCNSSAEGTPLSDVQGYQTGGCDSGFPPKKKGQSTEANCPLCYSNKTGNRSSSKQSAKSITSSS